MLVFIIWSIIAFIIGFMGLGKYILNTSIGFWAFIIFGVIPGIVMGEMSDYGSISGIIFAPGTLILLSLVAVFGELFHNIGISKAKKFFSKIIDIFKNNIRRFKKKSIKNKVCAILIVTIATTTFVFLGFSINYVYNSSYRELDTHINNQTLKQDMCGWGDIYYDIIESEKGKELVTKYLENYKDENNIESALWLINTLPSTTTESILSEPVSEWIINYAQINGVYSTNKDTNDDYYYLTYYELKNYCVIIPTIGNKFVNNELSVTINKHTEILDYDSKSNYFVAEVPYYGMDSSNINNTALGHYDKMEMCRDYYALEYDHRSITYYWYDSEGNKIFSAYALAGKVISTTDIRNGKIITDSGSNHR